MRLSVIASASLALLALSAGSAFAQETAAGPDAPAPEKESAHVESGFELGARLGVGLGLGKAVDGGASMSDTIGSQLPLTLDIGYRINKNFYVGGYGGAAYGIVTSDACKGDVSCSAQSYRVGANVHYHILPDASFDPWIGVGAGYEWMHVSTSQGSVTDSVTLSGFELVNLQVGGDYHVSRNASIGPYAAFSVAQFNSMSETFKDQTKSADIDKTAFHELLSIGIRGTFDL